MGKGAKGPAGESFENKVSTHGQPLTAAGADFAATVKNLGGDPDESVRRLRGEPRGRSPNAARR